jgi:hypothetical protein
MVALRTVLRQGCSLHPVHPITLCLYAALWYHSAAYGMMSELQVGKEMPRKGLYVCLGRAIGERSFF